MSDLAPADPWSALRALTPARIGLGRVGSSLPTGEVLRFGLAHALAQDAVHRPLDVDQLAAALQGDGWACLRVRSRAADRPSFLLRPDLGRQLADADAQQLAALGRPPMDLAFVAGDGLSSLAVQRHVPPLLAALRPLLAASGAIGPVVIAEQARVALGDEIGALLGARIVVVLIGERPGLSSPDSLGTYLTYAPRPGRRDAERNCVSNVRPEGLGYEDAARQLAWLVAEAGRLRLSGIGLKDLRDMQAIEVAAEPQDPSQLASSAGPVKERSR